MAVNCAPPPTTKPPGQSIPYSIILPNNLLPLSQSLSHQRMETATIQWPLPRGWIVKALCDTNTVGMENTGKLLWTNVRWTVVGLLPRGWLVKALCGKIRDVPQTKMQL